MKNKKIHIMLFILTLVIFIQSADANAVSAASSAKPEFVSAGAQLTEWMETHKDTGGTVKLSNNITLDDYYCFVQAGKSGPSIFIDTGNYTITVTGEVEFFSMNRITFSGTPDEKGIFHVTDGGLLAFQGVNFESSQYALWQDEGAGLLIDGCSITGNVHYADIPFVLYKNSVCAVVEPGQTAEDVLPSEIKCKVNYQGQVYHNEMVPVVWNQTGSEKYQENRLRFQIQGSFPDAASQMPPLCTVAYNDYPLTFTEIDASTNGNTYIFRGGYIRAEESLPITVLFQYSFDGENWHTYDENTSSDIQEYFFIGLTSEEWNTAVHPWIYIRLQWQDDETPLFSNVLRYSADNLDYAEDQGGNRGGGTSIVNPPDEPQEIPAVTPPATAEPINNQNTDTNPSDTAGKNFSLNILPSENTQDNQNNKTTEGSGSIERITHKNGMEKNKPSVENSIEAAAGNNTGTAAKNDTITAAGGNTSENSKENSALPNIQSPAVLLPVPGPSAAGIITILSALLILTGAAAFCFYAGIFRKLSRTVKNIFTK